MPEMAFQDYFAIVSAIIGIVLAALFSGHKKWRVAAGGAVVLILAAASAYFLLFRPEKPASETARLAAEREEDDRASLSSGLQAALGLEDEAARDAALLRVIRAAGRAGYTEYADSAQKRLSAGERQAGVEALIDGLFASGQPKLCARAVSKIELVADRARREALRRRAAGDGTGSGAGNGGCIRA